MNFALDTRERRRALRFLVVGISSTALDFGLLALFKVAGLDTLLANTLAYGIATVYNFIACRWWTYAGAAHKPLLAQFGQYLGTSALGLALNDAVIVLFEFVLHHTFGPIIWSYLIAKASATGAVAVWSYVSNRLFVFRGPSSTAPEVHVHTTQRVFLVHFSDGEKR